MRNRPICRRSGFTLIELLVVISIILVLAALTAGTVFRVLAGQSQKRTETTLKKLQTGLEGQWQAVIDSTKDELTSGGGSLNSANSYLYSYAKSLSAGDPSKLRAIYIKFRLTQEFPTSFAEALTPNQYVSAGKQAYANALAGATPPGEPYESAICLYLAINQGRRGATFSVDDVGPSYVASRQCGSVGLNYFVDSYGQPITFERWADQSDSANLIAELSAPPYAPPLNMQLTPTNLTGTLSADKDDPEGALYRLRNNWTQTQMNEVALVLGNGNPSLHPINASMPQNLGFIIRSSGPNKKYYDGDDLLGYRLMKEGQRGN
jgi:prepilin-type N-terminal cleavage/methylation domain-containing protein